MTVPSRSKKPLSDPRPGHRMRHAMTTCLGLSIAFAVGEVLVRYARAQETFHATQLSLAVFTSVATSVCCELDASCRP